MYNFPGVYAIMIMKALISSWYYNPEYDKQFKSDLSI